MKKRARAVKGTRMSRLWFSSAITLLCASVLVAQPTSGGNQTKPSAVSLESARILLSAKRIFVEPFGDDAISKSFQSMVVDAIGATKRFIATENKERADLILKGAALEKSTQEVHSLSSGTTVAGAHGSSTGSISGNRSSISGSSYGNYSAQKLGISDSQSSVETVNDARASVRLVSKDGDVVWSTTQESKGAKYKGATADVADKIVKQLVRDLLKLEANGPAHD